MLLSRLIKHLESGGQVEVQGYKMALAEEGLAMCLYKDGEEFWVLSEMSFNDLFSYVQSLPEELSLHWAADRVLNDIRRTERGNDFFKEATCVQAEQP